MGSGGQQHTIFEIRSAEEILDSAIIGVRVSISHLKKERLIAPNHRQAFSGESTVLSLMDFI